MYMCVYPRKFLFLSMISKKFSFSVNDLLLLEIALEIKMIKWSHVFKDTVNTSPRSQQLENWVQVPINPRYQFLTTSSHHFPST